jgi:hypothetical protein
VRDDAARLAVAHGHAVGAQVGAQVIGEQREEVRARVHINGGIVL